MRPLSRKTRLQRLRKTVNNSLEMPSIKSAMPRVGSGKAAKAGLIAAGPLACGNAENANHK